MLEEFLLLIQAIIFSYFALTFTELNNTNSTNTTTNPCDSKSSISYSIMISLIVTYLVFNRAIGYNYLVCTGIQLRTICTTALYKKVIKLRQAALHNISIGHLLNFNFK